MVSSISSSPPTLAVPTKAPANDPIVARQIAGADRALNLLIKDSGLQQSLADNTNFYVPPGFNQILSLLWGVMNADASAGITKTELEHAVRVEGGSTSDADALYAQLKPEDPSGSNPATNVNAGDFASNDYLNAAIFANLKDVQDSVNLARIEGQAAALSGNSILAYMFGGSVSGSNLNILS